MVYYETVTETIDVSFRGRRVDWELIMMKNTEDCQHLLLHSPPAQKKKQKNKEYRTQKYTQVNNHSRHTRMHTNCITHTHSHHVSDTIMHRHSYNPSG